MSFMGASACMFNEKLTLEKKWRYYDRFYPEPTQLQKVLIAEAQIWKKLDQQGFDELNVEDQLVLDPET